MLLAGKKFYSAMRLLFVFVVLLLCTVHNANAAVMSGGPVTVTTNFYFLAKFAFFPATGSEAGVVDYDIIVEHARYELVLYSSEQAWNSAYGDSSLSCTQRVQLADYRFNISSVNSDGNYELYGLVTTNSSETKFWFIAVSDCANNLVDILSYKFMFKQADGSEFSAEMEGILTEYTIFFVFYVFLFLFHVYGLYLLLQVVQGIHRFYIILTAALGLEVLGIILHVCDLARFSHDGVGIPGATTAGDVSELFSQIVLVLLLLLLAHGWTIATYTMKTNYLCYVIWLVFAVLSIIVFIVGMTGLDPASTATAYQSWEGILLLVFRCLVGVYFCVSLVATLRAETLPEKRSFYHKFGIAFSLWFVALPVIVAIGTALDTVYRDKLVIGFTIALDAVAFGSLVFLTWPGRSHHYLKIAPPGVVDGPTLPNKLTLEQYGSI